MGTLVVVTGVFAVFAATALLFERWRSRHTNLSNGPSDLWLPSPRPQAEAATGRSILVRRFNVGPLTIRLVAVPFVATALAALALGYRIVAFAEPLITVGEAIYALVRPSEDDRPKVEFLAPLPPVMICGLFDVAVRLNGGHQRQSFIAVRDRTLNRLHNILRILPDENGRFEAELGAYFPEGDYDVVVVTPRRPSTEVILRAAEVVAGGPSPDIEGILAPDGEFAYYAYGSKIHVPSHCDIK